MKTFKWNPYNKYDPKTVEAFIVTECRGMARVDFFLRKDNTFILNEINTLPGFTKISMFPKLWEASGLPYTKLLDKLIELASWKILICYRKS